MGKSPGKWIKTVLLGKKNSKSKFPHGKEKKPANGKEVHVQVMAPETVTGDNPQEVHCGGLSAVHVDGHIPNSEYQEASIQQDEDIPAATCQNADYEQTRELDMIIDTERITQEIAATKTQAAFRGYLARRAFKAVKGIIRLQALIRGHLVRRQAVTTLHCIVGIVKLQALVRGSRVRCSNAGIEIQRVCFMKPLDVTATFRRDAVSTTTGASLTANSFIRKLLASSPEGMPLRVHYDETDSNSVQIWLERWSTLCPWKPTSLPMKSRDSKTKKKQGSAQPQAVEGVIVRPKRSVRRVPSIFDDTSAQPNFELEKPRRNQKNAACHPADSTQENSQNELEKVKRGLKKVQNPVIENSAPSDVTEMPQQSLVKAMIPGVHEVPDPTEVKLIEKVKRSLKKVQIPVIENSAPSDITEVPPQSQVKAMTPSVHEVPDPTEVKPVENIEQETGFILKEEAITVPKENGQGNIEDSVEPSKSMEIKNGEITMVSESFEGDEKDENNEVPNGELKPIGEAVLSENHDTGGRASLPVKLETVDDGLKNSPKLPSYMQATKSAKAKSRGQGSPRVSQDSAEKPNLMRRHSLSSPANGKVNSVSPRTPKPLQGSGKGGNKNDKSLVSSRDGNGKTSQGWCR